jgi:hypothetical protein
MGGTPRVPEASSNNDVRPDSRPDAGLPYICRRRDRPFPTPPMPVADHPCGFRSRAIHPQHDPIHSVGFDTGVVSAGRRGV